MSVARQCGFGLVVACFLSTLARSEEPAKATQSDPSAVTLENFVAPSPNAADEPLAKQFSLVRAVEFMDSAALDWQKSRQCFTCHTNFAHLMVRPAISANAPAHAAVRGALEKLVSERWKEQGPRWDAEVVMAGAVLALNDAATTGKLHPLSREALDRIWTVQREDGGFDWLKCGWPPMESDDHFGATMAAIGVGAAPEAYAQTEKAQAGLEKIRGYLKANPAPTLHHRAMVLWASTYVDGFISPEERQMTIDELVELQQDDGGWALASLGDWKRSDGKEQDTKSSDGYGTGFVIYVLRRTGLPSDEARLQRGIAWLKANQRASGRWFTRSLNKDNKHFITHAGTAFALLALTSCDEKAVASSR